MICRYMIKIITINLSIHLVKDVLNTHQPCIVAGQRKVHFLSEKQYKCVIRNRRQLKLN